MESETSRTKVTGQDEMDCMYSVEGKKKGRIINHNAKRCGLEGCLSYSTSVRWEDGSLTYPCKSMIKQVSAHEYQICHTMEQLTTPGYNKEEQDAHERPD